jgi:hypothetical protein
MAAKSSIKAVESIIEKSENILLPMIFMNSRRAPVGCFEELR